MGLTDLRESGYRCDGDLDLERFREFMGGPKLLGPLGIPLMVGGRDAGEMAVLKVTFKMFIFVLIFIIF